MGQAVLGPQHPDFAHYQYVGVDSSLQSLKVAQQLVPTGWLIGSSAEQLALVPSSVDVIICFGILMYVSRPNELLAKLTRALKSGGVILVHEPILRKQGADTRSRDNINDLAGVPLTSAVLLAELERSCKIELVHREYSPIRTMMLHLLGDLPEKSVALTRLVMFIDQFFIRLALPLSKRFGPGAILVSARRKPLAEPACLQSDGPRNESSSPSEDGNRVKRLSRPESPRKMKRNNWERLLRFRNIPLLRKPIYYALLVLGCDIPPDVKIGARFRLPHGIAVVIHNATTIGDRVTIFSCVTIGRADAYRKTESKFEGIRIEDDVVLSTGCRILCKEGLLVVAKGSVIGANAVLLNSTKPFEVWVGVPARCIGTRNLEGLPIGDF